MEWQKDDLVFPNKLNPGDEIRVIAPSRSLAIISKEQRDLALSRLNEMGLKVTFGRHAEELDEFRSSSVEARVEDLHQAFTDSNVKGILTVIGGFNSNQLLKYLDYDLIRTNPKILCGFSDITALSNAIYAKSGVVTYSGPHYSTFGMKYGIEYTIEYFKKCLFSEEAFEAKPSESWSDDPWYADQESREFIKGSGYYVINGGEAEGISIGGNLCTLNLLQGTEFMPSLKDSILFLEDDEMACDYTALEIDRNLQSLIHLSDFSGVRGMVIGGFQKNSKMNMQILTRIIKTKKELDNIPVIAEVNFGHTTPQITFPIGGRVSIKAFGNSAGIVIAEH